MTRWTEQQLQEYEAKIKPTIDDKVEDKADAGKESVLAGKIVKWAKNHGFWCLYMRQSQKAKGFLLKGWPDITLLLLDGRVIFLELKAQGGRQSPEQIAFQTAANFNGHEYYVVKSYKQFFEIAEG